MRWRIFYGDGLTFGNEDGSIAEAPWLGVIAVVQDCYQPPQVLHQVDNYWWRPDWQRWVGGDDFGFQNQAAKYGATWLKKGETILPERNQEIMARAVALKDEWNGRRN